MTNSEKGFTLKWLLLGVLLWLVCVDILPAYSYGAGHIASVKLKLEICQTPQEKTLGLGGRTKIAPDYGMLFLFDQEKPAEHIFWMKGMLVPIDIIWLRGEKVVHVEHSVPPPASIMVENLPAYGHGVIADKVLEVKAGFAKEHKITRGQTFNYQPSAR